MADSLHDVDADADADAHQLNVLRQQIAELENHQSTNLQLGDEDNKEEEAIFAGPPATGDASLTLISSRFNKQTHRQLLAETFIHVSVLPDYPKSSDTGVAYVVSARGKTKQEMAKFFNAMQFCKASTTSWRKVTASFLDNAVCRRVTLGCTGVKACEHLSIGLQNMKYTEVTESIWEQVASVKQDMELMTDRQPHHSALVWLYGHVNAMAEKKRCKIHLESCRLTVRQIEENSSTPARHAIRCIHAEPHTSNEFRHFYAVIPTQHNQAVGLLENVLNGTSDIQPVPCYYTAQNIKHKDRCPHIHPQNSGKLVQLPCQVKWNIYIPLDLESTPYALCVGHGQHTHPPPPASSRPVSERVEQSTMEDIPQRQKRKHDFDISPSNSPMSRHNTTGFLETRAKRLRYSQAELQEKIQLEQLEREKEKTRAAKLANDLLELEILAKRKELGLS
ncbi:hypothetical protein GGR50DRAFT_698587 [Xylaria sp. CBS 124048]|nr:hypothetical protein GGR50DRAFT_698587 [Xylaria sp. CBS 124048]